MKRYPSTGISAIVVGGGIAGLTFAIEAHRKGHDVRILDRRPFFDELGDIVGIQSSALHTPAHWPGFLERARALAYEPVLHVKKHDGTPVGSGPLGTPGVPTIIINRSQLHRLLAEAARDLGIPVEFNAAAASYFETKDVGGVLLEDGRALTADVVVAADGAGSRAWGLVLGRKEKAFSSGFAVYRVTFPAEPALRNPVIAREFEGFRTRDSVHIGPGTHIVVGKTEKEICWMLSHKDEGDSSEDWTATASIDDALKYVEGWTPFVTELIRATPGGVVTNWKLMWRDPVSKWASPEGRVIQIGDAAHTFLPTSGSGATMAMEDAYSLATCLQLGGRAGLGLAVRVHNEMRYERVSCAQKMGWKTRENFNNTDWDKVDENPQILTKPVGDWVLRHDPEQYAYDNYGNCAKCVLEGKGFENTNAVPGHTFKPWTIKELLGVTEAGGEIVDDGDWS
ncbi:FAD binding domain protein [Colletotrichum karsti]|uniref:FAD binding domain protein n=1 Tax=Colletotrichum karsti TaxID=1095194 RepID=A0A9P6HSG3_9PEZI|nr:FAD binding domain protein [Colletotrichum karsti]KAF9869922.1 FAD binding domain protein [Colletotrichum karsti]